MTHYLFRWGLFVLLVVPAFQSRAQTISLVNHTNTWRYRKGQTSAPQANGKTVAEAGLDGTWLTGNGGFGFADNVNETNQVRTVLADMHNAYTTVAMRRTFQVTSNINPNLHLFLRMDWDDGFIAWLDGAYLTSAFSPCPPTEPVYNDVATGLHESSAGNSSPEPARNFDLGAISSRLAIGTHVLAIVGLNELPGSSDFIQIADLNAAPAPTGGLSGTISTNTTWRAADSPITIVGDITVNPGVTLTIEPGVRVLFNSGISFDVAGQLLAEGDPTNRIVFTRAPANPGTWGGITISGACSPESRLRYAHVEFNSSTAISVPGGTAWLDHLTFGTPSHTYIEVDGASFIITDCEFPSATVKFEFIHGTGGIRAGGHGIIARNFFGLPVGYSDVIDFTGGNRPSPTVHIINNVFSGATDDGVDLDGTDGWIEGNIFQHVHRRGDTPDSSAAVSGGNNSGQTSELTVIRNIFFDCDNAATAKQSNFFTFYNNTIVHTTNAGGIDIDTGAVNVRDTTPSLTSFGRGFYLEGNIIFDAPKIVRNYDSAQTAVTLNNNIVPLAWTGPGTNNVVTNPRFKHVPTLAETVFTNWADAQVYWDWFSLLPGSPAIGTGPNGQDKGAVIPMGVYIFGEPIAATYSTNTTLVIGINRTGFSIPTAGWPSGAGYTAYKYRLDGAAWSAERSIATPISLHLATGPHYVEVVGKRDSGFYQDDPLFGDDAVITRADWIVEGLRITSQSKLGNNFNLQFPLHAAETYTVQYRDGLDAAHAWTRLTNVAAQATANTAIINDANTSLAPARYYRVVTPALP
ncbi:MAG TPA: hypothetical protein VK615_04810 [Candidatus Binatia bacterium]|nr:hypothetical protein [Candidatus Binatia bacterium]